MQVIIRSAGERTENLCISLSEKHGAVHVIKAVPFGESIRQTYLQAIKTGQKWTTVIDADVLLYPDTIAMAIAELDNQPQNVFCLDGKTDDKIMMKDRRAGVHIYRTALLEKALQYIDNNHIKPESNVRRKMEAQGFPTYTGKIVFGKHDYEQFYCDLWRKTVCQTQKLAKLIKDKPNKWKRLAKRDLDYEVIYRAHEYGKKNITEIVIDVRIDYDAKNQLAKLGIKEKDALNANI